jgi:hypothetical protein
MMVRPLGILTVAASVACSVTAAADESEDESDEGADEEGADDEGADEDARPPPKSSGGAKAFKPIRDQGIHYFRRKLYPAARVKLEQADRMKGGGEDFRTQFFLGKLYYEQMILERAFPRGRKAVELASDDHGRKQAKALLRRMEDFFAGVTIVQAEEQEGQVEEGYIHLEDKGGLINVKKKEAFKKIRERFKATAVRLPTTIYLPFGKYTANLAPFQIKKGETAEATTYLYKPDSEGISAWWYVGGGAVLIGGATAAVLLMTGEEPDRTIKPQGSLPFESP